MGRVQGGRRREARRIVSGVAQVRLSSKEFDLLSYLVAHANKTIGHRELLRQVWGPDYGGELEYLHVFVNRRRKQIEATPGSPKYLLTEPWFGYRLELPQ